MALMTVLNEGSGDFRSKPRWSANRKMDVVLRLLRGEKLEELSRELGVETLATALADIGPMQPVPKAALRDSEILGDLRDGLGSFTSQLDSAAVELRRMRTGHVDSSPSRVAPNSEVGRCPSIQRELG